MKEAVFNSYVGKVTSIFNISQKELFSKSKKRVLVDARHLLYYLALRDQCRYVTSKTICPPMDMMLVIQQSSTASLKSKTRSSKM